AEKVSVFELNARGGAREIFRLPACAEHELFKRFGAERRAFKQADALGSCLAEKIDYGADDLGMNPVGHLIGHGVELVVGGPGHVELDGHGLAADELIDAAKLIEHGRE